MVYVVCWRLGWEMAEHIYARSAPQQALSPQDNPSSGPLMRRTAPKGMDVAPAGWRSGREAPGGIYPEPFIRFYPPEAGAMWAGGGHQL